MSVNQPPDPYFNNINFNPNFFKIISTYLTETIANSKYLRLIGGILSGNLGIKRTPRVELDVVGKAIINTGLYDPPNTGISGSGGAKLILTEGTAGTYPYALGTDAFAGGNLWYGVPTNATHIFYTGNNERMRINNNGAVAIGTNTPTSGNTRLTISGASSGYTQPLVDIIQTGNWDGNYALQVTGYANLGGFRINGADIYGNITQTLVNKDITFGTSGENTTAGDIKFTTFGAGGNILFNTNGNNQRMRISATGNVGIGTTNNPEVKLDIDGSVLIRAFDATGGGTKGIFFRPSYTASPNNYNCSILTYDNDGSGGCDGLSINAYDGISFCTGANARNERMRISVSGNVGIGTNTNAANILQVGNGGKLRISNGTTDYTLIGSKDTDDENNTRIVIHGYQRSAPYQDFAGTIEYRATSITGAHTFWLNDATAVVDIDNTDFTVYNSITTIGYNYFTDGEYIVYSLKTNSAGTTRAGYFITNEYFFNSMINIAVSHISPTYTYWHGHYGTNNSTNVLYITAISSSNMAFEIFIEQGTLKSWILIYTTIASNSSTPLRVKFYG
jgi:hypothetical protein